MDSGGQGDAVSTRRAREMARQINTPAAQPDELSLTPRTNVKKPITLASVVLVILELLQQAGKQRWGPGSQWTEQEGPGLDKVKRIDS